MIIKPKMTLMIDEFEEIQDPSWEDVVNAIRSMDGRSKSIVMLDTEEKTSLLIGGGNNGNYLISYYPDDSGQTSFFLSDVNKKGDDVEITVQTPSMFPARWCMPVDIVISVINGFYKTGRISNDYHWEEG